MSQLETEDFENDGIVIPAYLEKVYWWAYVRPWAVRLFEREWLVNLILWGFYRPLRDLTLGAMGARIAGRTLKISCCYGRLEPMLAARVKAGGGTLDLIDVAPEQLKNAKRKLAPFIAEGVVRLHHRNAVDIGFADGTFDRALIFFLPHEQPEDVRRQTFAEAFRVVKPGGTIYVVEFGKPRWWHPLKYIWHTPLYVLEPFAPSSWNTPLATFLPRAGLDCDIQIKNVFGDFYQLVTITTPGA